MRERSTAVIEDDVATEVEAARAEPPTILVEQLSDSRKPKGKRPRIRAASPRTTIALLWGIGVIGLLVGFVGAWLFRAHSVSNGPRQALPTARQQQPMRHSKSTVHEDVDRAPSPTRPTPSPKIVRPPVSIASAADLLMQNRYQEALTAYRALSELHPDQPVFNDVLSILEVKLRCGQASWESGPCD